MSLRSVVRRACLLAGAVLAACGLAVPASAEEAHCDRQCLAGLVTTYLDALVTHEPARLPLASDTVRFSEDSRVLPLGEGLWQTVTGRAAFRQDYLDTAAQVAAAHVELAEGDTRVLFTVVLHVSGQRIAGIETLVQRVEPGSRFWPTQLGQPIPGMDAPVAASARQSRGALVATALSYANGLRIGNFTDAGTPFAAGAFRIENGVITAGEGCVVGDCGLYSQRIMVHPGLIPSVAAVDEEQGIVLLWINFGFTDSYGPGKSLVTFEAFKVADREISRINAFFATLPISTPRGWPSLDPVTARAF